MTEKTRKAGKTRKEWLKILLILAVALALLMIFDPGLQDSPYNEF